MKWIIENLKRERIHRNKMLGTTPPTSWEGSQETWDLKEQEAIKDLIRAEKILTEANEPTTEVDASENTLPIQNVRKRFCGTCGLAKDIKGNKWKCLYTNDTINDIYNDTCDNWESL